ncbi:MAG: hypothetical protein ACR2HP_08980 [Ilumatobacteraceae bacterium]
MSGAERYIEEYRARMAAAEHGGHAAPPDRRRLLVLTAAFTPMMAAAALPVTALIAVVAWLLSSVTARWGGVVVLVAAVVGLGYATARWSMKYDDVPAVRGWRRWLPLAATIVVAGASLAEIVSGSRAPDPVIVLWLASVVWVAAFLPLAASVWGPARRALWAVGPAVTLAAILVVWTQGFFSLRFTSAVPDFDVLARQVANGDQVADGTDVGGFVVHDVNFGRLGRSAGCDVEFWITGWHEEDTRYITYCVSRPMADFTHLAGDWWQIEDRTPPSNLPGA